MQPNRIVRLLIAICVCAAFLSAQMATSFAVQASQAVDDQMQDMQTSADGSPCPMPCCPNDTDAHDCGCPPGICVPVITIAAPSANAELVHRDPSRSAFAIPLDQFVEGIDQRPPDDPPRPTV